VLENSESFDGVKNTEAKAKIIALFEKQNLGKGTTNYKLRNWGISVNVTGELLFLLFIVATVVLWLRR